MDGTREHHLKLARLRRRKIAFSSPHADYRPKTNAVMLLDIGHALKGEHAWEE
jgi:hypothetical protein